MPHARNPSPLTPDRRAVVKGMLGGPSAVEHGVFPSLDTPRREGWHLVSLTLDGVGLRADEVDGLASGLRTHSSLTALDLSNNPIGQEGATTLAKALTHGSGGLTGERLGSNGSLTSLVLSSTRLTDEGVRGTPCDPMPH